MTRSLSSPQPSIAAVPTARPAPRTLPLARRLLFPTLPLETPLPEILGDAELDEELYEFIALALRAFVQPWWSKLTRFDHDFLPRITLILVHVFRALAARLHTADLSSLVFRDAPGVLTQHVRDHRAASHAHGTAYASGGASSLAQLFHYRQAHIAVSPDGAVSEDYLRCVVDHILRTCLPTEDYAPETERTIVTEIVLMILVRSVIPKVTQPWFIQKIVLDQLGQADANATASGAGTQEGNETAKAPKPFSVQTIVVFVLHAIQSISGFFLLLIKAYKSLRETMRLVNLSSTTPGSSALEKEHPRFPNSTSIATTSAFAERSASSSHHDLMSSTEEKTIKASSRPTSISGTPPLFRSLDSYTSGFTIGTTGTIGTAKTASTVDDKERHIPSTTSHSIPTGTDYTRPALDFVAELLGMRDRSASSAILALLFSSSSAFQPFLSKSVLYPSYITISLTGAHSNSLTLSLLAHRFLPYTLNKTLRPSLVTSIVRSAKKSLFPDGWPGPPPIEPTPEEQVEIRRALVKGLTERIPGVMIFPFFSFHRRMFLCALTDMDYLLFV
jgi:hypothetical protein